MLSWLILIDRGFNPINYLYFILFDKYIILVFRELFIILFLSDDSESGTPGPIPNPEVKPFSADDSVSENRALLRNFFVQKFN